MEYFGSRCRPVPLRIWAWPLTFPRVGILPDRSRHLGLVRSGSAAGCVGLRCLFLVVIVSRPGPDARFFFVLRKRSLNLGGRCRAADQTLASVTLVSLHPESGIPDRLTSDECVSPCVGSQLVFPPLQGGMDDSAGFPGDALDEANTLEVTVASAECADCGGLRYSLCRDDLQSFCY